MASKDLEKLEEEVTCPLCFEKYNHESRQPKMLPCQHTFCHDCLNKHLEKSESKNSFRCPNCNKNITAESISSLPNNLTMTSLIDALTNMNVQKESDDDLSSSDSDSDEDDLDQQKEKLDKAEMAEAMERLAKSVPSKDAKQDEDDLKKNGTNTKMAIGEASTSKQADPDIAKPSTSSHSSAPEPTKSISACTILVCGKYFNLPSEDSIRAHFSSEQRSGGGCIVKMDYDRPAQRVLVEFDSSSVVDRVLAKHNINQRFTVERWDKAA